MYKLYHYPLCPFSRKVRFLLSHFNVPCVMHEERFWERRGNFFKLSPSGTVPVLIKKSGSLVIPHSGLIVNHLLAHFDGDCDFTPNTEADFIKVSQTALWFDEKFFHEVSKIFIYEKIINTIKKDEMPDVEAINTARYNLQIHFEFLEFLLSNNRFLCGENFSLADLSASMHLSVLDYLSEIKWNNVSVLIKDWYSIIKSKLAFKEILLDRIPNIKPSSTYEVLDF
jgi:glutathione S-transferase